MPNSNNEGLQVLLRYCGIALVAAGMIIAFLIFWGVVEIYNDPESNRLYALTMNFIEAKTDISFQTDNSDKVSIEFPTELRLAIFYFSASIFVLGLASLLHAFLSSGLKLLTFTKVDESRTSKRPQ